MPIFWSALLMQYIFALKLRCVGLGFYGWKYVIIAGHCARLEFGRRDPRLTRSSLLEVMRRQITSAPPAPKGQKELAVIMGHALKKFAAAGRDHHGDSIRQSAFRAAITESVFGIPGMLRLP